MKCTSLYLQNKKEQDATRLQSTLVYFILPNGTLLLAKTALLCSGYCSSGSQRKALRCQTGLFSLQSFSLEGQSLLQGQGRCASSGHHPAMGKWLIFMRTSTIRVYRGIWRPQTLFLASLHQSVWVYLLTICWCFDISLLICLLNERLMTHSWSEVIPPWAKNWLLLLPWAIPSHFLTEWMLHSRQNKEDSSPICLQFLSPPPGLCS